jgi:hypothetical protein
LHDLSSASLIEIRFSSIALEPDLIGIEPGEDLAGSDLIVVIGENLDNLTGEL